MRPLLLLALLALPLPLKAEEEALFRAPQPGCAAPALTAALLRRVAEEDTPVPFRHAMLRCPLAASQPRIRRT